MPAGLLFQLVELVRRWDIAPEVLLGSLGLDARDLAETQARIPFASYLAVIERARALTGEPGLGFCWGLQMRVSAFGYLGFATLSAGTLREAIELVIQFSPLISTAMSLRLEVEGGVASLTLEEHADFGSAQDVVVTARLTGLWCIAELITGRRLEASAEVGFPEPDYYARFAHLIPEIRFGRGRTRALMNAEVLDTPLVMADPAALRLARKQCQAQLETISAGGRLVRTVRHLLWKREGGLRSPREVAKAVHMSPRTLRRKLALHGSSLSLLLGEMRRNRAVSLLRSSELSIEEMSGLLGYGSVQNFTRAFRQWTGATPAAYRRSSTSRAHAR